MSFDMRQSVLMVRSLVHSQPFYNFYNAEGLEFSLPGCQLKEIYDTHFEGRMSAITTYWGFSNKSNYESFEFAENGDLLWHVSLNSTCHTLLPLEMVIGHEGFNVINGFEIGDHKRTVMKIHQKAVGRTVESLTWFHAMTEKHMREMLCALGHGPMRIERADRDELIKIHREWQRKHDEEYKYTHNACGIDPDDKLPADLYDDHGKWLRRRHMAKGKTIEMMASELANIVRMFELDGDDVAGDFDHLNPDWDEGLRRVAQAFIYGPNAKERFDAVKYDSQFIVNGIYALAKDLNWLHINDETQDYQESLMRRLMQELKNEVERPDGMFLVEEGKVYLKATATADADVVDEVEDEDEEEDSSLAEEATEVRTFLEGLSEGKLRHYARMFKLASTTKLLRMDHAALVDLCADHCGSNWPEDLEEEEDNAEAEKEQRQFPALLNDVNISYEAIRKVLSYAKLPMSQYSGKLRSGVVATRTAARKKVISSLIDFANSNALNTLPQVQLETLAYALTKMKDGDRYPRDAEYLKELIKHATR